MDALLANQKYNVFGLSRNPDSAASKALKARGVEVLKADFNDKASVVSASAPVPSITACFGYSSFFLLPWLPYSFHPPALLSPSIHPYLLV